MSNNSRMGFRIEHADLDTTVGYVHSTTNNINIKPLKNEIAAKYDSGLAMLNSYVVWLEHRKKQYGNAANKLLFALQNTPMLITKWGKVKEAVKHYRNLKFDINDKLEKNEKWEKTIIDDSNVVLIRKGKNNRFKWDKIAETINVILDWAATVPQYEDSLTTFVEMADANGEDKTGMKCAVERNATYVKAARGLLENINYFKEHMPELNQTKISVSSSGATQVEISKAFDVLLQNYITTFYDQKSEGINVWNMGALMEYTTVVDMMSDKMKDIIANALVSGTEKNESEKTKIQDIMVTLKDTPQLPQLGISVKTSQMSKAYYSKNERANSVTKYTRYSYTMYTAPVNSQEAVLLANLYSMAFHNIPGRPKLPKMYFYMQLLNIGMNHVKQRLEITDSNNPPQDFVDLIITTEGGYWYVDFLRRYWANLGLITTGKSADIENFRRAIGNNTLKQFTNLSTVSQSLYSSKISFSGKKRLRKSSQATFMREYLDKGDMAKVMTSTINDIKSAGVQHALLDVAIKAQGF